jgi:S-adenosylmethionine:tRNA-ribosyltransferase-isomerase (queuine synthetase)
MKGEERILGKPQNQAKVTFFVHHRKDLNFKKKIVNSKKKLETPRRMLLENESIFIISKSDDEHQKCRGNFPKFILVKCDLNKPVIS